MTSPIIRDIVSFWGAQQANSRTKQLPCYAKVGTIKEADDAQHDAMQQSLLRLNGQLKSVSEIMMDVQEANCGATRRIYADCGADENSTLRLQSPKSTMHHCLSQLPYDEADPGEWSTFADAAAALPLLQPDQQKTRQPPEGSSVPYRQNNRRRRHLATSPLSAALLRRLLSGKDVLWSLLDWSKDEYAPLDNRDSSNCCVQNRSTLREQDRAEGIVST